MKTIKNEKTGEIDRDKSRRVEFQFKLKEDEALEKVRTQLEEVI